MGKLDNVNAALNKVKAKRRGEAPPTDPDTPMPEAIAALGDRLVAALKAEDVSTADVLDGIDKVVQALGERLESSQQGSGRMIEAITRSQVEAIQGAIGELTAAIGSIEPAPVTVNVPAVEKQVVKFDIERDKRGFIESVIATPV